MNKKEEYDQCWNHLLLRVAAANLHCVGEDLSTSSPPLYGNALRNTALLLIITYMGHTAYEIIVRSMCKVVT